MTVLYVSSSAFRGNVGWAWSTAGNEPTTASGAVVGGSAYSGAMQAAVAGLSRLPDGTVVEVRTSNETLAGVGNDWMESWRDRDWQKPGGVKHLDLVKQLSVEDLRLKLMWTLKKSSEADFKPVKLLAQTARKTLPEPEAPEPGAKKAATEITQAAPSDMRTVAYTDGGCRGNPGGVGGWGMLLIDTHSGSALERWGGARDTTNNRMEMQAAIEALSTLRGQNQPIELRTDSKYLKDAATEWMPGWKRRGWKKGSGEDVANVDLLKLIDQLQNRHRVKWTWVRGHQGEPGNEHVDALATQAMDELAEGKSGEGKNRFAVSPVPVARTES